MSEVRLAYYPGCGLNGTARELDHSFKAVCGSLGIELQEVPDWNCCGGNSANSKSRFLAFALPARNILNAEKTGCLEMIAPCPACYVRHQSALKELKDNEVMRQHLASALGRETIESQIKIKNLIEICTPKFNANKVVKPLKGLKVVNYYGCALVRTPKEIGFFDDAENPHSLDTIMGVAGARCIEWPLKTECCGASLGFTNQEAAWKVGRDILRVAKDSGANAIVVACNMCQMNLDMRQAQINKKFKTNYNIPVIYFTQLLGLALGCDLGELGLDKLCVDPMPLLRSLDLV